MSNGASRPLRIGTRSSQLALWQAEHVAAKIRALGGSPPVRIVKITTTGDQVVNSPLSRIPGKGFFTKEIEQALLEDQVDVAVHSLKDLETTMPPGLTVAAVLTREDPRDVLIGAEGVGVEDLKTGAVVGTSSLRRRAMLANWRPDLNIRDVRGNVPTRIRKYLDGDYDALILAAAGVKRLGLEDHIAEHLPPDRMYPAVSQGALAVQARDDDDENLRLLASMEHEETRQATLAERALLRRLEGGCQVPVGALGRVESNHLTLSAAVCSLDGHKMVKGTETGPTQRCEEIGKSLAETLLAEGGATILKGIREQN